MASRIDPEHQRRIRRLRDLLEPLAASVYFAPECHDGFERLGFGPSSGSFGAVAAPERRAYFASRGGCLGDVPGETIAAAFGVFDPAVVVAAVDEAWRIAPRAEILAARLSGQRAFLERALTSPSAALERITAVLRRGAGAANMAARPLYAGLRSLGYPGDLYGDLWRAADLVREHRGDGHIAVWSTAGLDGAEIMLLTELWWGLPPRTYSRSRGWSDMAFDAAQARLVSNGLVDGGGLTEQGRALRRSIETDTDLTESRVIEAIGGDLDELIDLLEPVATDIADHDGYPRSAFLVADDLDAAPGSPDER